MPNAASNNEHAPEPDIDQALMMAEQAIESFDEDADNNPLSNNDYFRCLGYHEGEIVLMNKRTAFIQYVKVDKIGSKICLSLAPYDFWHAIAPKLNEKGQETDGVYWERIIDLLFRATEDAGLWNNRKQHEQGARFDRGRVAFHTGERVWMEELGLMLPGDVQGENCYTSRIGARLPEFDNAFEQDSSEIRGLLKIIKSLAWREDSRALSEMTLFGYLSMAPICGILKWRPHIWLDGARGDGKTWVVQNIVNKILGPHCEMVKSNSTESGLRNLLHARAVPIVFDEAEGSSARDKARMEEIISLARHTSSETDAVVAQGVSGGGASRRFSISSMFFLASIATRIDKPSDQTRFARISLGPGLRGTAFTEQVEIPAHKLFTEEFTDRFVARSILHAKDAENIIRVMTTALMLSGMERRVADVYAVFASGAWLALRDDIPADEYAALSFIQNEFGALEQIKTVNSDLSRDRDHDRIIRQIMSATRRIETANGPIVSEKVGVLMAIVTGNNEADDSMVTVNDAMRELNNMGIRPSINGSPCDPGPDVKEFLIHRRSEAIRSILEKTPYEAGFADILLQSPGVKLSPSTTRFRGASPERGLMVPVQRFIGDDEPDDSHFEEVATGISMSYQANRTATEPKPALNGATDQAPPKSTAMSGSDPFEEDAYFYDWEGPPDPDTGKKSEHSSHNNAVSRSNTAEAGHSRYEDDSVKDKKT